MKLTKFFAISAAISLLILCCGCAPKPTPKDWGAIGGSKSDATVKLGYQYNPGVESPVLSPDQAIELARRKCRAWGYEDAEPFGSIFRNCTQSVLGPFNSVQCINMFVSMEYQCTGQIPSPIENVSKSGKSSK